MHSSLSELGMDSMMGVEIKQTLEREFDIYLTAQDIRGLTFAKLVQLSNTGTQNKDAVVEDKKDSTLSQGLYRIALLRFLSFIITKIY